MKINTIIILIISILAISPVWANDKGTVSVKSTHDVKTTMDKVEAFVTEKGFQVFARVNHTAGAKKVGMQLRPTELLIFGNPKGGTVLMQCNQWVGLDLPLKVLVWQDENKQTMIGYNAPSYYVERHALGSCGSKVISKVTGLMKKLAQHAAN